MTGKRRQNVCLFFFTEDVKVAETIQFVGHRNVCLKNQRHQSVKEENAGTKDARENDENYRPVVRIAKNVNQRQTYQTTTTQPWVSLLVGANIPKGDELEGAVSAINSYRRSDGIRKDIERIGSAKHVWERMVFATPSRAKSKRVWQSEACSQSRIKIHDVRLAGTDPLNWLIGTIFNFQKGPVALTADIESMFLQVQVHERDKRAVYISSKVNEPVQISEYQRNVFAAKISTNCSYHALKPFGLDNGEKYPTAAKAVRSNFYMDDFIK